MNVKILVPGVAAAVLTVSAAAAQTTSSASTAGTGDTSANVGNATDTSDMAVDPNASMAPQNSMGSPDTGGPGPMDTNPPVDGAITGLADQVPTMGQGHDGSDTVGTPAEGTPDMSGPNQPQ